MNSLDQETKIKVCFKKIEVGAAESTERRKYGWGLCNKETWGFHGQEKGGIVEVERLLQL